MTSSKSSGSDDEFHIEALFPNWHNEEWVSYTMKSILEAMASNRVSVGATVMAKARHVKNSYVHPVMHRHALRFFGKYISSPIDLVYKAAGLRLSADDVAYFWLDSPAALCEELRERHVMTVREMINCTLELRRRELRKAYALMNMPDASNISDEDISRERSNLLAMDAVFCPNGYVRESVMAYGVPPERCLQTSYGWSESRLAGHQVAVARDGAFTVAFIGTIDVRKGAPLLLDAWQRSGIVGRLLLAGNVSPEVMNRYGSVLSRPDVVCLGHVKDVGSVYRSADVFCFPTWEEGGPLVTLEAMSAGVVPIVTGMGTSGAFSDDDEIGLVVPPGDVEALIAALQLMAREPDRRRHFSERAAARSKAFTWDLVGERRRAALVERRRAWLESTRRNS